MIRRPASHIATLALAMLALAGCAPAVSTPAQAAAQKPAELRVSAAATLKGPFEKLAADFESEHGVTLVYNFGASGVLQKQIEGGSPADVFASASPKQVDALTDAGLASAEETVTFARNDVVIIVPAGNPAGIAGPEDLIGAKRLVTGNPETAPHGTKAKEWLQTIGLWDDVEAKMVFGENAGQTLDFVARGEVDAGVVFASEAVDNDAVEVVYTAPEAQVKRTSYVAVPVGSAEQPELAAAFLEYLLSEQGQKVLTDSGFIAAP